LLLEQHEKPRPVGLRDLWLSPSPVVEWADFADPPPLLQQLLHHAQ